MGKSFNQKFDCQIPVSFEGFWAFGKNFLRRNLILTIIPNFSEVPLWIKVDGQKLHFADIEPENNNIWYTAKGSPEYEFEFSNKFIWHFPNSRFEFKDKSIELGKRWSELEL